MTLVEATVDMIRSEVKSGGQERPPSHMGLFMVRLPVESVGPSSVFFGSVWRSFDGGID